MQLTLNETQRTEVNPGQSEFCWCQIERVSTHIQCCHAFTIGARDFYFWTVSRCTGVGQGKGLAKKLLSGRCSVNFIITEQTVLLVGSNFGPKVWLENRSKWHQNH